MQNITAQECGLAELVGKTKQIKWASSLRDRTLQHLWSQGWYGTESDFKQGIQKLPTDAAWWIDNRIAGSTHEAARQYLGLEYTLKVGA